MMEIIITVSRTFLSGIVNSNHTASRQMEQPWRGKAFSCSAYHWALFFYKLSLPKSCVQKTLKMFWLNFQNIFDSEFNTCEAIQLVNNSQSNINLLKYDSHQRDPNCPVWLVFTAYIHIMNLWNKIYKVSRTIQNCPRKSSSVPLKTIIPDAFQNG